MENNFNNTERMLKNYLLSSKINNYNPLKDYLSSCPKWDESKPDYINQLSGYINTTNQEWFEKQFKKMLVRSLACALKLTPFNKQIFTLVGKQNDGKTSFLRFLCPSNLRSYYTENIRLDKDGLISLAQNIFINLDEIATIPYKDRDRIKSLVTADQIKERLPYASKATKIDRIANFMASTNEKELLTDDTGNVRWLIFEVENIKHDNGGKKGYSSNIDIDNVYAQAYFLLENNFKYSLTSEDIRMSESNNDHFVKTTSEVEILIDNFIQDPEQKAANFRSTTDIQHELSELYPRIKINHTMLGRALKSLGYKKTSLYTPEWGKSKKGYYIKHLSQPTTSPEDVWTN
jgi:predicted P-loop ATPase